MNLIPNIPPKLFSLSAVAVGYLLIDDTTANEQNALGNWLMLVAQILCTNAFYKQVQAERGNTSDNTKTINEPTNEETVMMLKKMVNAINKMLEEMEKDI